MRNQRRSGVSVRIIRENVTEDALGNETDRSQSRVISGCQFDLDHMGQTARSSERSSSDQVRVVLTGVLNLPGCHSLVADDLVEFQGSQWQVVGHSQQWGRDRTKVRVQRAVER